MEALVSLCLLVTVACLCLWKHKAHAAAPLPVPDFMHEDVFAALPVPAAVFHKHTLALVACNPRFTATFGNAATHPTLPGILSHEATGNDLRAFIHEAATAPAGSSRVFPFTTTAGTDIPIICTLLRGHGAFLLATFTPHPLPGPRAGDGGHDAETPNSRHDQPASPVPARLPHTERKTAQYPLTDTDNLAENLWKALEALGTALEVDRIYVWQNTATVDGALRAHKVGEWVNSGIEGWGRDQGLSYAEGFTRWGETLAGGQCIRTPVRDMPPPERGFFLRQGTRSLFVAPIHLLDEFWGFIGVDDCRTERTWSDEEESILFATGLLVGTAFARLQTNDALRHSENLFHDVAFASGEMIWEVTASGRITFCSERSNDILGIPPGGVTGRKVEEICNSPGIRKELFEKAHKQIHEQGFFRGIEHTIADASGRQRHLCTAGLPVYGMYREIVGLRCTSQEVTESKMREGRLAAALASVQAANEQLAEYTRITQELALQAKAANTAKSEFLANIGHEVRTPINVITGMAYLALRTDLNATQKEYITKVHEAGLALLHIINTIIDFAKMENKELDIIRQPLRIRDIISTAMADLAPLAEEKKLAISSFVDPSIPQLLMGDVGRLGQVFKILIHNAIKFTGHGSVDISCLLREKQTETAVIACRIADTGKGMTPEEQACMFQPFAQANASASRQFGGTGVSLALVQRLVEAMHGEITVETRPGAGTSVTFTVRFGLAPPDEEVRLCGNTLLINLEKRYRVEPDVRGATVLVYLDKERAQQHMAIDALKAMGLSLTIATSVEEALTLIEGATTEPPFELIFAPLLPRDKAKGVALSKAVRSIPACANVPLIVLSPCLRESVLCDVMQQGVTGCISPELAIRTFRKQIACLLHANAAARERGCTLLTYYTFDGQAAHNAQAAPLKKAEAHNAVAQPQGALTDEQQQHLEILVELLEDDDAEARNVAEHLRELFMSHDAEAGGRLFSALATFDFVGALEALHPLQKRMKYPSQGPA